MFNMASGNKKEKGWGIAVGRLLFGNYLEYLSISQNIKGALKVINKRSIEKYLKKKMFLTHFLKNRAIKKVKSPTEPFIITKMEKKC